MSRIAADSVIAYLKNAEGRVFDATPHLIKHRVELGLEVATAAEAEAEVPADEAAETGPTLDLDQIPGEAGAEPTKPKKR